MKIGLQDPAIAPAGLLRISQAAAVAGRASSLWVPDHLINIFPRSLWSPRVNGLSRIVKRADAFFDPFVALSWLAAHNRLTRLRLGVSVTDAGRRNPAVLAQAAASLHLLNRGRTVLGIGSGERENNVPYGVDWSAPVARLEEALGVIRALWESGGRPVSREGAFFPLRDALFDLPPYRGTRPQIWVAAHGPRMLDIAGRYGDGWLPAWPQSPAEYGKRWTAVQESAATAGRDPSSLVGSAWMLLFTGPSPGFVDAVLSSPIARSLALTIPAEQWARHGVAHPLGPSFTGLQDLLPHLIDRDQALDLARQAPVSLLRSSFLCGTPAEVLERLAAYRDEGLSHPIVVHASPFARLLPGVPSYASLIQVLRGAARL